MYCQRVPAGPLSDLVELLWDCSLYIAPHSRERVLPCGRAQMIINLDGGAPKSVVTGFRTGSVEVETGRMSGIMGVVFKPGGLGGAHELFDRSIPLDEFSPTESRQLIDHLRGAPTAAARLELLEANLASTFIAPRIHPVIQQGLDLLSRNPSLQTIRAIANENGLSARRFTHLFNVQVGITPKAYARLVRFQGVVGAVDNARRVEWASVAADCGFSDQPHLVHEFRAFAGTTPSAFIASRRPFRNHVAVDR